MNLTSESFIGIVLIMFAAIIIQASSCNCIPYYLLVSLASLLIIKGILLVVDDIKFRNKYIYKILCILFPR